MAKELQNLFTFVVEIDDTNIELLTECSIHYGVRCEHNLEIRKGMPVQLSPEKLHDLEDIFVEEILPQMMLNEGIEEVP